MVKYRTKGPKTVISPAALNVSGPSADEVHHYWSSILESAGEFHKDNFAVVG